MSRDSLSDRVLRAGFPVLCGVFLLESFYTAWVWLGFNRRPGLDQDVWLQAALAVRDGKGLSMGNDHPLYTAVLSLWAGRNTEVFTWSKLFSLAVLSATVLLAYRVGKSLFDRETGLLAAVLLSANWIIFSLSISLRAEVLLPLFFLCHWYCAWRGFREDGRWWLGAGLFAGLAYLTKGTGTLLVLAWAGACLAVCLKDRSVLGKIPWFLLGYLPLAGLLWWGNRALFGDATYNFSIRHAMWLDSWEEAGRRSAEELTLTGYVASHGAGGVLRRLAGGAVRFLPVAASCLAPSDAFPLLYLARWPLAAGLAAALWVLRRRVVKSFRSLDGAAVHAALLYGLFYFLFGWYNQVSSSERFMGPLNPMLAVLAAAALRFAWKDRAAPLLKSRAARARAGAACAGLSLLAVSALGLKAAQWGLPDPFSADKPLPCYEEVYALVDGRTEPAVYGPSGELSAWFLENPPPRVPPPEKRPPDLPDWLAERGIRLLAVDWDMAAKPAWSGHFVPSGEQGIAVAAPLPGWREIYRDGRHEPPHVIVLERGLSEAITSYNQTR